MSPDGRGAQHLVRFDIGLDWLKFYITANFLKVFNLGDFSTIYHKAVQVYVVQYVSVLLYPVTAQTI